MTKRTKIKVIKMRISIDDDHDQGDFNEDPDREVEMTIINLQYEMNAVFCTVPYPSNMFDKAQVLLIFRVLPLDTERRWFSKFISHASRHLRIG